MTIEQTPAAQLRSLLRGTWVTHAIAAAAHIGLADLVHRGVRTSDELARAASTHPDATYRLMRALASLGLFVEEEGRRFSLTAMGDLMRSDAPESLAPTAKFYGSSWHDAAWSEFMHSIRTGETAFDKAFGKGLFEYLEEHPDAGRIFNDAHVGAMSLFTKGVVDSYDFSQLDKIADVGGGHGELLFGVLRANPHLTGVLFDLPSVIEGAKQAIARSDVRDRCESMAGSFFESVPPGCDAYLLSQVIHNWGDDEAVKILSRAAEAMKPSGRVLVVDQIVPGPGVSHPVKLVDLQMLALTRGRARTEAEIAALMERAGLELSRVISTRTFFKIVEGVKAGRRPVQSAIFRRPHRVGFTEVDAGGRLFGGRVFEFFIDTYHSFLRTRGIDLAEMMRKHRCPMVHVEADFSSSMVFGSELVVEITDLVIGASSLSISYRLVSAGEPASLHCTGKTVHVWVDPATQQKMAPPAELVEALGARS